MKRIAMFIASLASFSLALAGAPSESEADDVTIKTCTLPGLLGLCTTTDLEDLPADVPFALSIKNSSPMKLQVSLLDQNVLFLDSGETIGNLLSAIQRLEIAYE